MPKQKQELKKSHCLSIEMLTSKKSIIQKDTEYCFICSRRSEDLHPHHVMNGAFRSKAEEDGLIVFVHDSCHSRIHTNPVLAWNLKRKAQRCYEKYIGSHDEWMSRYGSVDYLASFKPVERQNRRDE